MAAYAPDAPDRAAVDRMRGLVALEFGIDGCGHCQAAQAPLMAALGARGDIVHLKIEDGKGRPLGRSFRIKLWPTVVLLRDGAEVARIVRPTNAAEIEPVLATL